MIKLTNINKSYLTSSGTPLKALSDINLTVHPGEIFGVIGESGAGKSTLIRCVNLLERPDSGQVQVNNHHLMELSPAALRKARHRIGMVFQHFNLLSSRTVSQNIALPLEFMGVEKKIIKQRVIELLELVRLGDKQNTYPNQLSGGQKQRVAIARALATKPDVLLCDEMTSALDPTTTNTILDLIRQINQEFKLTILLITHEMHVIKRIAHRVAVMEAGKIIEENKVVSLFSNPQSDIAKAFIHSDKNLELPDFLKNQLKTEYFQNSALILQLTFIGKKATEPVIENLIKTFSIDINILQAHLEFLGETPMGNMLLSAYGDHAEIDRAKKYLTEKGLKIEELGYVPIDNTIIA